VQVRQSSATRRVMSKPLIKSHKAKNEVDGAAPSPKSSMRRSLALLRKYWNRFAPRGPSLSRLEAGARLVVPPWWNRFTIAASVAWFTRFRVKGEGQGNWDVGCRLKHGPPPSRMK
jgi:hypothetical protein